jgi:signal transduction histidine kinase
MPTVALAFLAIDRRTRTIWVWAAAIIAVFAISLHAAVDELNVALAFALGLAQAGSILLALVRPRAAIIVHVAALIGIAAGTTGTLYVWPVSAISVIALAALLVALGLTGRFRYLLAAWTTAMLAMTGVALAALLLDAAPEGWLTSLIVAGATSGLAGGAAVVGAQLLTARRELRDAQDAGAASRVELTGAQERARIAREMHDVVAHGMSLVHMRASSARYRLDGISEETAAEFDGIAEQARGALAEMRGLLSVLRSDDVTFLAPQPGLDDLAGLIESSRAAGLQIEASVAVIEPSPTRATQLALYRVAQESLSNIVRHAPGAAASVHLSDENDRITLRVRNSSSAVDPSPAESGGLGIRGMIERMTSVGGTLDHGPNGDGYLVTARVPRPTSGQS